MRAEAKTTHICDEMTLVSEPSSGVFSETGCRCRELVSGRPVSLPRRNASCFCCSSVISCARKKTTPRCETSVARSRMSSSLFGADRSAESWVFGDGNSVPTCGVRCSEEYEASEPRREGGMAAGMVFFLAKVDGGTSRGLAEEGEAGEEGEDSAP